MIRPTARQKLTKNDFEFICTSLSNTSQADQAIRSLLTSPEERDAILDDPDLFEKILATPNLSKISPVFYFYVLVRRALQRYGLDDRDVADYIASMLAEFSKPNRAEMISDYHQKQYKYLVDLIKDLMDAHSEEVFLIQSHLGNYSMFLIGIFPDYVYHKTKYGRMAPDFSYYEQMGSTGYKNAAGHRVARKWDLTRILEVLAAEFRLIRYALNYMVDSYMKMDRNPNATDRALRRVDGFIAQKRN